MVMVTWVNKYFTEKNLLKIGMKDDERRKKYDDERRMIIKEG